MARGCELTGAAPTTASTPTAEQAVSTHTGGIDDLLLRRNLLLILALPSRIGIDEFDREGHMTRRGKLDTKKGKEQQQQDIDKNG